VCEQQWQPGFHGQGCWAQFVRVPQVVALVLMVVLLMIMILFVMKMLFILCWGILMLVMMEVALVSDKFGEDIDEMNCHNYTSFCQADFNCVSLPPSISFPAAAALGCRFSTAYRCEPARFVYASKYQIKTHALTQLLTLQTEPWCMLLSCRMVSACT
jgi:hypothetical protein